MGLFDFLFNSPPSNFDIDKEPIYDQSGSTSIDATKPEPVVPKEDDYLNRLNGLTTPIGSLTRNAQYIDYSFRTYGNYDTTNFQLVLNVSRLWYKNNLDREPGLGFSNDFQHRYYAMATPGYYGGLSKIIVDDNGIKGYNETEIQGCIVNLTITKVGVGFNIKVHNNLNVNRKVYLDIYKSINSVSQVDQKGLSKACNSFDIKIDTRDIRISDLSQIYNAIEKISEFAKEAVENNFKEEARLYKKKLYTSEVLSNYRKNITPDSVTDMLVHINDALGEPSMSKTQDVFSISYAISSTDGLMKLDKKMSDALYEISELTGRIKSLYEKVIVDIKIVSSSLILTIRPDTTVDGDNLAWMDYTYTGPFLDIQTYQQPIGTASFGTQSQYYGQFTSE